MAYILLSPLPWRREATILGHSPPPWRVAQNKTWKHTSEEPWREMDTQSSKPRTGTEPPEKPWAVIQLASTISGQLIEIEDQYLLVKKSNVIYQVPCSCGPVYIDEMKRVLEIRIKEHKTATRRGELEKQNMPVTTTTCFGVWVWMQNTTTLLIKEALYVLITDTKSS